jgi:nitrate/TMAO reductase-like tetraheme cytochrome c subunit
MTKSFKIIIAVSLSGLTAILAGCASQLYKPVASDAAWATQHWQTTSQNDLARGRSYYVTNCSSCHKLYSPQEHDESGWVKAVDEMKTKARIADTTADLIVRYLVTGASHNTPAN